MYQSGVYKTKGEECKVTNGHVICIVSSRNNIHTTLPTYRSISLCEVKPYISISYICIIWAIKRNILTSKRVHCFDCCPVIPVERCLELEIKITHSAFQCERGRKMDYEKVSYTRSETNM